MLSVKNPIMTGFFPDPSICRVGNKFYTVQMCIRDSYINSAYLGQIFRKKYGQSFKNYLCSYRINEACHQLLYTNKRIRCV